MTIAIGSNAQLKKEVYGLDGDIIKVLGLTVPSATNQVLVVACTQERTTNSVSAVTHNGVALTKQIDSGSFITASVTIWTLVNPSVGSFDVIATTPDVNNFGVYTAVLFTGVDQATPVESTASYNNNDGSPLSNTVTCSAGAVAVAAFIQRVGGSAFAVSAGATAIGTVQDFGGPDAWLAYQQDATAIGFSWTGGALQHAQGVVVLKPAAGAVPTLSGAAPLDNLGATGTFIPASGGGTFTSEALYKNVGGGVYALRVSEAVNFVALYNDTTNALIVKQTGLSTNASGIVSFNHASLAPGVTVRPDIEMADGGRIMPRVVIT